jgi:hypothetical protein
MKRIIAVTLLTVAALALISLLWLRASDGETRAGGRVIERVIRSVTNGTAGPSARSNWQRVSESPFVFYGKVVDDNGIGIEDVKVLMNVGDGYEHSTDYASSSDKAGIFIVKCKKGSDFSVSVTKYGYHTVEDWQGHPNSIQFLTRDPDTVVPYVPDKNRPIVFSLKKQGIIEPLKAIGKPETFNQTRFRINLDGAFASAPLYIDGKKTNRNLIVRCWVPNGTTRTDQGTFSWKAMISAENGEIIEQSNKMEFVAPETGYLDNILIDFPDSTPRRQWLDGATRVIFVRFSDNIYARVKVTVTIPNSLGLISGFLNPKPGSRYLETATGE